MYIYIYRYRYTIAKTKNNKMLFFYVFGESR